MEETGKIKKIIFEYENVTKSLSDEQAIEWLDLVNGMCVSLHARNQNPFENKKFEWIQE